MLSIKELKRLSLTIGCSDSDMAADQTATTEAAIDEALKKFNIEGASISYGRGYWRGVMESNITLTIINNFTSDSDFMTLSNNLYIYLLEALKQEQIAAVIDSISSNL